MACKGYAKTGNPGKAWHKLSLNYDDGLVADHINNKTFDNRLENLRIATCTENSRNRTKCCNNVWTAMRKHAYVIAGMNTGGLKEESVINSYPKDSQSSNMGTMKHVDAFVNELIMYGNMG